MDRDEALGLLRGGPEGVSEWNRRRKLGEATPALSDAALRDADLRDADLRDADLRGAHLIGARLIGAHLNGADLSGADLRDAFCQQTVFADVDLSEAKGLDSVDHNGPSTLGTDTLIKSRGKIPEVFLRGCGLPDAWIEYLPALIGALEPIQFYSVFISYSSKDTPFAERLYADLQSKRVRCWYAPQDLRTGDRFRPRIDEAIRQHEKLLIVLTEHSIGSQEVENEVEAAMDREKASPDSKVLFPIRLDDAAMDAAGGWPALVRRSRHIGDFRRWKDHDAYQKAFARLLRDLKAEDATAR